MRYKTGVRLGRSPSAHSRCCCFTLRLGGVARNGQPLKVGQLVVIAALTVVALSTDAVTVGVMLLGFAPTTRSSLDRSHTLPPVAG